MKKINRKSNCSCSNDPAIQKKGANISSNDQYEKDTKSLESRKEKDIDVQRQEETDDEIDIEAFENGMESTDGVEMEAGEVIQRSCPQGKQKKVIRNDCATGKPVDESNYITSLEVDIAAQTVTASWSGGGTDVWPCSPNPRHTPRGGDMIGIKCGINHTNQKKDGMAWFTGFASQGYRIGFHDSQRVGTGIFSHGCVRVSCTVARLINHNSWSGKTTINVT